MPFRLEPFWYLGRRSSGPVNTDRARAVGQAQVPGCKDEEAWTFQAGHGGSTAEVPILTW